MKAIAKRVLWILFIIALFGVARAGTIEELDQALRGTIKVYPDPRGPATVGVCWFDKDGILTFKYAEKKRTEYCMVGMKPEELHVHYVLLVRADGRPKVLYSFNDETKEQKVVWVFGAEV